MRNCRRCKDNESEKGSLNCEKCNKRNEMNNNKLLTESKIKNLNILTINKSLANDSAYGGLGREADKPGFDYSVYHFD